MADKRPKPPTDEAMKARALSEWEGEGGAPSHGRKPKRPRDPNQLAKSIIDIATGQECEKGAGPIQRASGKDRVQMPPHRRRKSRSFGCEPSALIIGSLSAFFAGSPEVLIGRLGISPTEYGFYPPLAG